MAQFPSYLQNYNKVIDAFGYWPDFHDSPVLRFEVSTDSIELELEAWEMTDEKDARGYFKLIKKHRIGFYFSGLGALELEDFVSANILFELGFSPEEDFHRQGFFSVELESVMGGLDGRFRAAEGAVTFIFPSSPDPEKS